MRKYRSRPGPHMIYTEVQNLEEAVDALFDKHITEKRKERQKNKPKTFRTELRDAKFRQQILPITLSDRVLPSAADKARRPSRKPDVVWDCTKVQEAWSSKSFTIRDLSFRAKVCTLQIRLWCHGPTWRPSQWNCTKCKAYNYVLAAEPSFNCKNCGMKWNAELSKPRKTK